MLLRRATIQERLDGSKAFELQLPRGSTGAERCSDRHQLEEVSHVDALVAHSLGAAFGIEKEVGTSRLGHRRRDPGLRTRASPAHERLENLGELQSVAGAPNRARDHLSRCVWCYITLVNCIR